MSKVKKKPSPPQGQWMGWRLQRCRPLEMPPWRADSGHDSGFLIHLDRKSQWICHCP